MFYSLRKIRGHLVHSVMSTYQILHSKPPSKPDRFLIEYESCNVKVLLVLTGFLMLNQTENLVIMVRMCNLDVEVYDLVEKIVSFTDKLRGRGLQRVCVYQILHRKPPGKPGRFSVDVEWFNARVDVVNRLLNDRLGRDFGSGVRFWRHSGFWSQENKEIVYCEDGVHLIETYGYPKYYNSVRASVVSALKSLQMVL